VHLVLEDPRDGLQRGWIIDAWTGATDGDSAMPLAMSVMADLRRKGASLAQFWSAQGPRRGADPMVESFRSLGLRGFSRGKKVLFRHLGAEPLPSMPKASAWMFRMGDTDGI
jgi:hypothetical protein